MRVILLAAAIVAGSGEMRLRAANPGDEVVVVYNNQLPESKAVADYYAERRQVPAGQVFGFALSTNLDITRKEFRDALQRPLAKAIQTHKLWRIAPRTIPATNGQPKTVVREVVESKVRYAVLCYGVPSRILPDPDLKEAGADKFRPELRRDEAAVDTELALLPVLEQDLPLTGPLRNPVYTATNSAVFNPTNGILMVTRLDGPTAEIARGLVDKALEAETNGLWGRAYFDLRNTTEPGMKPGDEWIRGAAEISRHLGFETVIDENPGTFPASFPMSQIALYMGWYDGDVSGPFTRPNVEFMPGAFAYHLHSYSARNLRSTNQNWVGPLLAKGATITMGCVAEPYLGGTPELAVFTARLLFQGFTFGEAAYASQPLLSWEITIVGDPLYRPFAMNPDLLHRQLAVRHSKLLAWSFLRLANLNLAMGRSMADVVKLLEQFDTTKHSAILNEKLGDLYAGQGKPESSVHAYAEALKFDPSPQQKIRLLLLLGKKLPEMGREQEAFESLQTLLRDFPDYPDKLAIYRELLPLAQKLGKSSEATTYQAEIDRLTAPPAPKVDAKTNAHAGGKAPP